MSLQCWKLFGSVKLAALSPIGYTNSMKGQVRFAHVGRYHKENNFMAYRFPKVDVAKLKDKDSQPPSPADLREGNVTNEELSPRVKRMLERRNYRFAFPEFLPDPDPYFRNPLAESLSRKDMLKRREKVDVPEFYVGSIVSVTMSDPNAITESKTTTFNGIVIDRGGAGLRAWFVVRNVVDHQGVEIMYHLYSPTIIRIETLKLERRLDDELYYLRDAPPEHSTVPLDMEPELLAEGEKVPLNTKVIELRSKPWTRRWEVWNDLLFGYTFDPKMIEERGIKSEKKRIEIHGLYLNRGWQWAMRKYDLMRHYRNTIPVEEQDAIWEEVGDQLEARDRDIKRAAIKRSLVKSERKK